MTETRQKKLERNSLLIELGCEELPPKALDTLSESLFRAVLDGLEKSGLDIDSEGSRRYSSPRRMAMRIAGVAAGQPDQELERKGPALAAAFDDDGNAKPAALGFARSVGKDVSELETLKTDQGEWLFARVHKPGKTLDELIWPILEQAIRQLPVPKPMRWSDNDFSFVRPVHWVMILHGTRVIEGTLLGQASDRLTRGHRIHSPGPHALDHADNYAQVLREAYVLADQDERRETIRQQLEQADKDVIIDASLLNEVNNLVEWPRAVNCSFDEDFLRVPHAALVASMQDHQKFFPVAAGDKQAGAVSHRFVAIANLDSKDFSAVREGYERVIRPRLADARFFLDQDLKDGLEGHRERLNRVVFQKDIGSIGDKSRRMASVSRKLAELLSVESAPAIRAAELAKCDLMTHMVGEFPELQGYMGAHYAQAQGEDKSVSIAIGEHYAPRFAGDQIPSSLDGQLVSLSDRADSLVGIFAAGLKPSGNKDPFALRRAALGLCRILLEGDLAITLEALLSAAAEELSGWVECDENTLNDIRDFVVDRLRNHYREMGFQTELINAVLRSGWTTLPDLDARLKALGDFMGMDEAASLASANKRIGNILRKQDSVPSGDVKENLLNIDEERVLFDEVRALSSDVENALARSDYASALGLLAGLKQAVDQFFDRVMVMDEDEALRANRLSLLARLKAMFDQIADLSVLA